MEKNKDVQKNKKKNKDTYKDLSKNVQVMPEEFEETRSEKIRMKPQPFNKTDQK